MEIREACAKGFVLAMAIFSAGYMMIALFQNRLRISRMMRQYKDTKSLSES